MELQDTIYKRQSVRKFKEQDVLDEDILKMVKAAGAAPSGKNIQNWHFVVIKRRDLMEKIADVITKKQQEILVEMDKVSVEKANRFRKFVPNFTLFYLKAPVLVLVFTKVYNPSGYYELELINAPKETIDKLFIRNPGMQSLGAAIENFTLSAIELGYGSCWLTSQNYAADEIEAVLEEETGFEKGEYFLGAMLALGVPEDNLKSPSKKPVEDICTFIK